MTTPRLSVVIPSHHRIDCLRACLHSVVAHAPQNTDILVIDDGSPNGCVSRLASEFPSVRCRRYAKARGFCVAANRGIDAALAPIVELLNDDTEVHPGWADAALPCFEDPGVVAVAPLVFQKPSDPRPRPESAWRIDSAGDEYDPGGFARKRWYGKRLGECSLERGPVFGASASSAFYRREVLIRVGCFPVSFGAYFEDVDLAFRLRATGGTIVFEPASRVWHRAHASYSATRPRLIELQSRNEERVFWRNLAPTDLLRHLPRHAAVLCGKALRRWNEGTLTPWLFGRLRVLGDIRAIARHRAARLASSIQPILDTAETRA